MWSGLCTPTSLKDKEDIGVATWERRAFEAPEAEGADEDNGGKTDCRSFESICIIEAI